MNIVRYEAPHNYNRRSREAVYEWLNRAWGLGHVSPIHEQPFEPLSPAQLTVFNDKHPRPADVVDAAGLKKYLIESGDRQLQKLHPTDAAKLGEFRRILGTAFRHMVATDLPAPKRLAPSRSAWLSGTTSGRIDCYCRARRRRAIPAMLFVPTKATANATLLVHPHGKAAFIDASGNPDPLLAGLLDKGHTVLAIDTFLTGEFNLPDKPTPAPDPHIGFFPCFNRTLLAQRVHDILTAVAFLHGRDGIKSVNLVGIQVQGPWCLLARGLCRDEVSRTAVDVGDFSFAGVKDVADPMYLPGGLKYGGLPALAALSAPGELLLSTAGNFDASWVTDAYRSAGADPESRRLRIENKPVKIEQLLGGLRVE